MTKMPLKACGRYKLIYPSQQPPYPPPTSTGDKGGDGHFASCHMGLVYFSTFFTQKLFTYTIYIYLFFEKKKKSRQKHHKPLCRNGFQMFTFSFSVHFLQTKATLASTL